MNWINRMLLQGMLLKMDGDPGATGGGDDKGDKGDKGTKGDEGLRAELDAIKAQNKELSESIAKLLGKKPEGDEDDLATKAAKERQQKEIESAKAKDLEKAMRFDIGVKAWHKDHIKMLPKTIEGIIVQADKENYGSTFEKTNAIKAGIVTEFFAVQENLDLLTDAQKIELEDFKKLTKNEKQDRVGKIYDNIFEPTFDQLKRLEKAKQVSKGFDDGSTVQDAYKQKMVEISKKRYLKI